MIEVRVGDCRTVMAAMPDESVHCVVTSPPYWGLRDYGTAIWEGGDATCEHRAPRGDPTAGEKQKSNHGSVGRYYKLVCGACGATRIDLQLGLEATPAEYVANMVAVFREVRRVLKPAGTLWLNLGDCYATGAGSVGDAPGGGKQGARWRGDIDRVRDEKRARGRPPRGASSVAGYRGNRNGAAGKHDYAGIGPMTQPNRMPLPGLKPKDLIGVPWMVAFALRADGWWLRQEIIWAKPNPMPESTKDRCTKAHEHLFLLAKSERYYYDNAAIAEPAGEEERPGVGGWAAGDGSHTAVDHARGDRSDSHGTRNPRPSAKKGSFNGKTKDQAQPAFRAVTTTRNKRSVWTVPTSPFPEAHFATFPPALIEPCILAGCPIDGTVLDPFGGAGTTGLVADRHHRHAILIELNPEYAAMSRKRISGDSPLFAEVT